MQKAILKDGLLHDFNLKYQFLCLKINVNPD